MKRIRQNSHIIIAAAFLFSLAVDIITKEWIASRMMLNQSISVLGDLFRLTYLKNSGIAFGIFQGFSSLLLWVSLIVVVILIFAFRGITQQRPVVLAAYGLIFGGAIGNILDRIRFNSVRDFLDFGINAQTRWPVFNAADAFIFVGIVCIILFFKEHRKHDEKGEKNGA